MISSLVEIIKDVGALLLDIRKSGTINGKWQGTQFKAEADNIAHNALSVRLKSLFPEIPIVSEEDLFSITMTRPEKYWLIDPIDGTASFAQGFSGYVTQIALIENNTPTKAVVYAPALNDLFVAEKNNGAFLNKRRIFTTSSKFATSFIDNYPEPRGIALDIIKYFNINKYIECGSISLKMCKVAIGDADLFVKDVPVRDWDIAAPHLILNEARGSICDIKGNDFLYINSYEHQGLIAASSLELCRHIISWYNNEKRGGK